MHYGAWSILVQHYCWIHDKCYCSFSFVTFFGDLLTHFTLHLWVCDSRDPISSHNNFYISLFSGVMKNVPAFCDQAPKVFTHCQKPKELIPFSGAWMSLISKNLHHWVNKWSNGLTIPGQGGCRSLLASAFGLHSRQTWEVSPPLEKDISAVSLVNGKLHQWMTARNHTRARTHRHDNFSS